jgi:hypothetical protein
VILAMIAIVAVVWVRRDRSDPAVIVQQEPLLGLEETTSVELPEDAPPLPLPEQLGRALLQIADGKLLEARASLEELSDLEESGELPAEVSLSYYSVVEALTLARADAIEAQLRAALDRYDLARLNETLRSVNGEEERQVVRRASGRALLERARSVLAIASILENALRQGELIEALEGANRLETQDPGLAAALGVRERAAAGIERSIDVLIEAGRLEEADARLTRLERLWPSRSGSAARRQTIQGGIA